MPASNSTRQRFWREKYRQVWGASGQGRLAVDMLTISESASLDILVILIFTMLLLIMYFILISHNFVTYVREIISGVEKMKSGDFQEQIPVKGEDEFSEIAYSINEMCRNLSRDTGGSERGRRRPRMS